VATTQAAQPPTSVQVKKKDPPKGSAAYRHKQVNIDRLRFFASDLKTSQGDLLDQALEWLFPQLLAITPHPDEYPKEK
jgi:hypothetical protein